MQPFSASNKYQILWPTVLYISMKNIIRSRNSLKLMLVIVLAGVTLLVSLLSSGPKALASASGPSPSHTNAPGEDNCTACHVDFPVNSGSGSVRISGVPKAFIPGQLLNIKVTTSQKDAVDYGFQMTAIDDLGRPAGAWALQDTVQTQIVEGFVGNDLRQYVEHTSAGIIPTTFGSKSWTFIWNAPAQFVGKVNFYAAGNAANGSGGTDGDYIYTAVRSSVSGSAEADRLGEAASDKQQ
jgi:hypothetical protein